jgi:di/tricarboxylate transporter
MNNPRSIPILVIGFLLCLLGMVLPFLMVMKILAPSFLLCFASFAASVSGLALGLIGSAFAVERYGREEG